MIQYHCGPKSDISYQREHMYISFLSLFALNGHDYVWHWLPNVPSLCRHLSRGDPDEDWAYEIPSWVDLWRSMQHNSDVRFRHLAIRKGYQILPIIATFSTLLTFSFQTLEVVLLGLVTARHFWAYKMMVDCFPLFHQLHAWRQLLKLIAVRRYPNWLISSQVSMLRRKACSSKCHLDWKVMCWKRKESTLMWLLTTQDQVHMFVVHLAVRRGNFGHF